MYIYIYDRLIHINKKKQDHHLVPNSISATKVPTLRNVPSQPGIATFVPGRIKRLFCSNATMLRFLLERVVGGYPTVVHRVAWPLYRFPMVNNLKLILMSFSFSYVILNSHLSFLIHLQGFPPCQDLGDNCRDQNWEPIYDTMVFCQQPRERELMSNFQRPLSVLIRSLPTCAIRWVRFAAEQTTGSSMTPWRSWSLPQRWMYPKKNILYLEKQENITNMHHGDICFIEVKDICYSFEHPIDSWPMDRPLEIQQKKLKMKSYTPPRFNIAPEKWWLEDYFPFGMAYFSGANC